MLFYRWCYGCVINLFHFLARIVQSDSFLNGYTQLYAGDHLCNRRLPSRWMEDPTALF